MALITQLPLFVCKSKNKKTTAITGIGGISWLMTRRSPQVEWPRGICFGGAPVMQGWLGWSQCRVWGSLYWSWPTNPGSGLWILHDHSDWKAMGFDLDMCPRCWTSLSKTSISGESFAHFFGRSVEIPCLKQKKIYNLEQLRQTRTHTRIIWWIDSQI